MPRTLYSPKLSDDVVRALYREAKRRGKPMTIVADELLRTSLAEMPMVPPVTSVVENVLPFLTNRETIVA